MLSSIPGATFVITCCAWLQSTARLNRLLKIVSSDDHILAATGKKVAVIACSFLFRHASITFHRLYMEA